MKPTKEDSDISRMIVSDVAKSKLGGNDYLLLLNNIEQALADQREKDAKIAEQIVIEVAGNSAHTANQIAAAIRRGKP